MLSKTKITIHNATKTTLKCGCEAWVFKKRVIEKSEKAIQMKFSWPLLGVTGLHYK
jgi:hypothetical protein